MNDMYFYSVSSGASLWYFSKKIVGGDVIEMAQKKYEREEDVRENIVGKAQQLFERFGPTKTTISEIAHASGMSPAHIYNFFSSKNDIIEAVADKVLFNVQKNIIHEIDSCKDFLKKMELVFISIHRHYRKNATPANDVLKIKLSEGLGSWHYERKFYKFVLNTVVDILSSVETKDKISKDEINADSVTILDCLFFGAVYSDMFRLIPEDEYENRILAQIDIIGCALTQKGYLIY